MRQGDLFVSFHMDVMNFLKTLPAVIGIAGFLTYFTRARTPVSDQQLVTIVQSMRNTFLLLGCAALILLSVWLLLRPTPPDHDTTLSGEHSPLAKHCSYDGNCGGWVDGSRQAQGLRHARWVSWSCGPRMLHNQKNALRLRVFSDWGRWSQAAPASSLAIG